MEFKDLKVGDWFTRSNWIDAIDEKIHQEKDGITYTHKDVVTGTKGREGYIVKDDDEVIPVCKTCNKLHEKTYGDGEWCENCVPY